MSRCPTCNSKEPHLHPATAFEGEVEVCANDFHLTPTNQNRPEYIAAVRAKQASGSDAAAHYHANEDQFNRAAESVEWPSHSEVPK